jgi:steroid delta-isomerase-like uncharacterized protein
MKFRWLLASCVVALFFCTSQRNIAVAQSSAYSKAKIMAVYDAFNTDNWDTLHSFIADDFVDHDPFPGQKPGFDGLKAAFTEFRSAFPDFKFTVNHIVAESDWVCIQFTMTGTNKGPFMGMPATGKSISVEGYDLIHIVDGKATEHWGIIDNGTMMMQLGMMPPPGAPPSDKKEDKKD